MNTKQHFIRVIDKLCDEVHKTDDVAKQKDILVAIKVCEEFRDAEGENE